MAKGTWCRCTFSCCPPISAMLPHKTCRKKTVRKEYMALAVGVPPQREFTVDAPIDRDEEEQ